MRERSIREGTGWLLAVIAALLLVRKCDAQQITLRFVNGKNGKPVSGQNVRVRWDDESAEILVHGEANGEGFLSLKAGAKTLTLMPGPKNGKEPNRIPYVDCNDPIYLGLAVKDVLTRGAALKNSCSDRVKVIPGAGEIVFYLQPFHWWTLDMQ